MTTEPLKEAHTQAVLRGLFGRDAIYMVLWGIQLLLAALLTPVTTRLLGPSRFGLVVASVAVMQVLVCIGSFSLQTAVQRAYAEPDGENNARQLVTLAIVLSLATFALAYASGPLWCPLIGLGHFGSTVRFAVAWAALTAITNAALGLIRSREQLGWFATVSLLQSLFAEALALALVFFVRRTSADYVLGQMLAQATAVTVAVVLTRPRPLSWADLQMLGGALRYCSALVPAALSAFVLDASDRLVLQGDLGSAAVGRYAVARNIGGLAMILLGVLSSVWMPRLFALRDSALQRSVLSASRDGIYALVIAVVVAVTMASPLLLWIWVPPSYHPETLLLVTGVIAITAMPMAGALSATRVLMLRNQTFPVAVGTFAAAGANLVLNLVFVPILGLQGSALATLFCYGLELIILSTASAQILPLPHPPTRLVVLAVGATTLCLLSTKLPFDGVALAIRIALALFAGLMFGAQLASMIAPERVAPLRHLLGWLPMPASAPVAETVDASMAR